MCRNSSSNTITGACYKALIVNHDKALQQKPSKQKLFTQGQHQWKVQLFLLYWAWNGIEKQC